MDRRILVVAALALGGCSLRLDTKDLDPLGSVETFCQTFFDEYLVRERDCAGWTQELVDFEYHRALALCAGIGWSESKGRVGYDRGAAEACLAEVRHVSCSASVGVGVMDDCEAAMPGTRPNGADCYDDVECADRQASCSYVTASCPGTCLAPGRGGDKCGAGFPACATGFYCDGSLTCAPALPENASCGSTTLPPCGENAFCTAAVNGTCVRYATEGQTCNVGSKPCLPGALFCDMYNSYAGKLPPVCRPLGTVPPGGACESSEQCDLAGWCDRSVLPGRCAARLGAGSPCLGDSMCARPLVCVGDLYVGTAIDGACAPRVLPGTICEPASADCQIGAACIMPTSGNPTCQPWPSQKGAACGAHPFEKFCYVGRCEGTTSPVCKDWLPTLANCTSSTDCGPLGGFGGPSCEMTSVNTASPVCVPGCISP